MSQSSNFSRKRKLIVTCVAYVVMLSLLKLKAIPEVIQPPVWSMDLASIVLDTSNM